MKIKVAHILHAVGGVDVSLRLIVKTIDSDNFESIVIQGLDDSPKPFLNNKEQPVKSYRTPILRNISPLKDAKAISKALKIVRAERPHIIHAHSAKGGVIAKIVGAITKTRVLHTPQAYSFLSSESNLKRRVFLTIEKGLSKLNNKILASSTSETVRAKNEVGYKENRVLLFNNAIDAIETEHALSIEKTWPDEYICSVARPSFQKNVELTIEVLNELCKKDANIHLVLMGVGYHSPNLESVQKKIAHFGLEKNITLLEWTQREDVFHIIKKAKLYISTARYEGLPYSVIESLALGKACVVTDADGNRDLIEDDKNGFVIFNENAQEFAEKTITLLNDTEKRITFEKASLARFNEHFNIKSTINVLEQIYRDECKKP